MFPIRNLLLKGLVVVASISAALLPGAWAEAASEKVLHSFQNNPGDGALPVAGLIDIGGTLYGTTFYGGASSHGTVFSVNITSDTVAVVHSFGSGSDGVGPAAGLIDVGGTLYGTTVGGGSDNGGTVFSVNPATGTESVVHSFLASSGDGTAPAAGLLDLGASLYGTTYKGGSNGYGTIFSIDLATGAETVLHSFQLSSGDGPLAGLIDVGGMLYGTTQVGGGNVYFGTVFEVDPTTRAETVVYSFNDAGGAGPAAGLLDVNGNLYGTTAIGGSYGKGTVFEISPATGAETVLHAFPNSHSDGYSPHAALIADSVGNLYGTTFEGGERGRGTVFELGPDGTETILYIFRGGSDGAAPLAGLIGLSGGSENYLYGTTAEGGTGGCKSSCGTLFRVSVSATRTATSLTASPNPSTSGQAVTFTAIVGSSAGAPPDGETVSFTNGSTVLGTGTLSRGSASFTTSSLPVGITRITAAYGGDFGLASSTSKPVRQVVNKLATTTTLSSSPNPSALGRTVTFTATVASGAGAPPNGETVSFKDGYKVLGTGTLNRGSALFKTSSLPVGTSTITAAYAGDPTFADSTSNAVKQVVRKK